MTGLEKGIIGAFITTFIILIVCVVLFVKGALFVTHEVQDVGVKGIADKVWNGSTKK